MEAATGKSRRDRNACMSVMYLGPNLKGIVRRNQIFTYHPDEVIEEAYERNPLTKYLFINMDDVVTTKKELRREGSFLNLTYKKIFKQEVENGRL